jgi:CRP/FNR family transcriptional regulator, cyclic AMP receptor protein
MASMSQRQPASSGGNTPATHEHSIAQVSLFAGLDRESLGELARIVRLRSFAAGEIIFHREDPGDVMYLIRTGKVRVFVTSADGQIATLALISTGECVGELALLDGKPRSASAVALEDVSALAMRRGDFLAAVRRYPSIAIQIMGVLSTRLRLTDELVEDLIFLDVYGRVAKKLLELAELHGVPAEDGGILIEMRLTQGDLAAMVGSTRETVNKVMGYFLDHQMVSTEKRKVKILRLAELRRRVV